MLRPDAPEHGLEPLDAHQPPVQRAVEGAFSADGTDIAQVEQGPRPPGDRDAMARLDVDIVEPAGPSHRDSLAGSSGCAGTDRPPSTAQP
jgi:hypothetical protein